MGIWTVSDVPDLFRALGDLLVDVFTGMPRCSGELDHHIVISGDVEGRPGYHLLAPGYSRRVREVGSGVTWDFEFKVGAHSSVHGLCLGRIAGHQTLEERADGMIGDLSARRGALPAIPPAASELAGCPAVGYTLMFHEGTLMTQWQFDHDCWAFMATLFRGPGDGPDADQLGRAALATWTWLPDDDVAVPAP